MKMYRIFMISALMCGSSVQAGCANNVRSLKTLALKEYVRSTMWVSEIDVLEGLPICLYIKVIRERSKHMDIGGDDPNKWVLCPRWVKIEQSSHNDFYTIQPWYRIFAPYDGKDTMEADTASWRCSIIIRLKEAVEHKKPFQLHDALQMRANIEEFFNEFPQDKALMIKRLQELQSYEFIKDESFKGAKERELPVSIER